MKQVRLVLNVDVDYYNQEENYYGEIIDVLTGKVLFDHYQKLKSFAFKEDMVFDLNRKCFEYGFEVVEVKDETFAPSFWEEI